ncbi:MAG: translational GTPase TypA [Alphaproteobacteria bacterium]|nr:translational GTPase TypA [Alphaproteobacteria bacterium]
MNLRNIAIVAHVDHGKTTLVDAMLKQGGAFRANQQVAERAMDSNDLERERGITILAKCTGVQWGDYKINIVDTPGHADFGGEVERILSMVDGVVLLVDAAEGPLPQTKFVLGKALALGLKPMVVINKIDRSDARPDEVHNEIFDLFAALDASDEQLDFPTLYASGRSGWAKESLDGEEKDLKPLFDLIVKHVPAPKVNADAPFSMLVSIIEANSFLGRVLTGRLESGKIKVNMAVKALTREGQQIEAGRVTKIMVFRGLERVETNEAQAGDIIAVAGLTKATVADTICDPAVEAPIPSLPVDPPTIAMTFSVNDSPLAGTEGDKVTSRVIRDRLLREAEGNVAIKIKETAGSDAFEVAGRGELQLGVLIETMRREGFELSISRPRVLFQTDEAGQKLEPIEEVQIDVDEQHSGTVVQSMSERKAEMIGMRPSGGGKVRITFLAPSRGLIGYHGQFLSETRGTGLMNRIFHEYAPFKGNIQARRTGVILSNGNGEAVAYAMFKLEDRGPMMIEPGAKVYQGMIVGEHNKSNDLEVNILEGKKLTNVRASGKDEAVRLTPPLKFTLEKAIAYIADDELVEVTPKNIRLRKRHLDPNTRKREEKARAAEDAAA